MARQYTPDTIVIAAAGNLDHKMIVDMVGERFGSLTGNLADWRSPETAPNPVFATRKVAKPVEQMHVVLGGPAYTLVDDRKYVLSLLDLAVGGGMSSRLFQEIREKRGLAYSVGTYTTCYREAGAFAVYAGTSPDSVDEVIEISLAEMRKVRADNITEIELQRAKNQVRSGMVMGQESMSNRMTRIGKSEVTYGRIVPLEEITAKIEAVTLANTHQAADELLREECFTLAQVGPVDE